MLDFLLVLGQIPGTDIQITFNELVVLASLAAIWHFRRQLRRLAAAKKRQLAVWLRLKHWHRRQLSLPM